MTIFPTTKRFYIFNKIGDENPMHGYLELDKSKTTLHFCRVVKLTQNQW